jgi:CBS domain-containing protein
MIRAYLDTKVPAAKRAVRLVVCEEAGSFGEFCLRADYATGELVAMVSGRDEADYLATKAKRPLSWATSRPLDPARLSRARQIAEGA